MFDWHIKPVDVDETEVLQQDEATDWTVAANTEKYYQCFVKKVLKCTKKKKKPKAPSLDG